MHFSKDRFYRTMEVVLQSVRFFQRVTSVDIQLMISRSDEVIQDIFNRLLIGECF